MSIVVVTGSSGLIGAEAVRYFHDQGFDVWGIDNDLRASFFGSEASTRWMTERLQRDLPRFAHYDMDIRDADAIDKLFARGGADVAAVLHTAAQPSHDWAAREPMTDFSVNATGTLVLLEATRRHLGDGCPFIFTSTNKVYGDTPNRLPVRELETRWELPVDHPFHCGIDESMSIDASTHSLFGVSKAAADLLVQEYGRYFGMPTACFRGGCLTGPGHSGAELHGFLAYLMRCVVTGRQYRIFGYRGKQVRDNIHSADLVAALGHFARAPKVAAVYNIGGGRHSNCSMLEAIRLCEEIAGRELDHVYVDDNRIGDHIWWIGDLAHFRADYPEWSLTRDVKGILREIYEHNVERWLAEMR